MTDEEPSVFEAVSVADLYEPQRGPYWLVFIYYRGPSGYWDKVDRNLWPSREEAEKCARDYMKKGCWHFPRIVKIEFPPAKKV